MFSFAIGLYSSGVFGRKSGEDCLCTSEVKKVGHCFMRDLLCGLGQSLDDGGRNAAHPRIVRRSLHGAYRGEGEREKRRRSDELPFHGCFPCRKLHAGQFAWTAYGDKGGKLQYIVPR